MQCAILVASVLVLLVLSGRAAASIEESIFHDEPQIGWKWGDHHVDLTFDFRYRYEYWQAFAAQSSDFNALRTRFGLDYRYAEAFRLFVQGQQASVLGLEDLTRASGEAFLYRAAAGTSDPTTFKLSQLFAEARGGHGSWARLGRQYLHTRPARLRERAEEAQAKASEPPEAVSWKFVERERLSRRLLGSVDWSHAARAYDGASAGVTLADQHLLQAYVYQPTTGVYDLTGGYEFQSGVIVGGLDWKALRGAWLENTEVGAFFIGYSDDRDAATVAGLEGDIEVYTLGASWLGVYPMGPGQFDVLAFGAFQFGDYVDTGPSSGMKNRNQLAGAFIAEVGYRFPALWASPWVRVGFNYASGDGNLDDDDRSTFFNLLPSNHSYYGYADQLALQNLLDLLVQVKIVPSERIHLEFTYHRFWLDESADFRWSGTGAFDRTSLGYLRNPSNGSEDVGHEFDLVILAPLEDGVTVSAGYSAMLGGEVFALRADSNLDFAYVEMAFEY